MGGAAHRARGAARSTDPAALARSAARASEVLGPAARTLLQGAPRPARLVGIAGTVTTLAAVAQALPRYDAERVHGSELELAQVEALFGLLAALPVAERAGLPGMEPKRADVIVGGCAIVMEAMRALGFERLTVSDRGVRWGLLYERFANG